MKTPMQKLFEKLEAIEYAERNFDYYFTFTIEKVYQITKY